MQSYIVHIKIIYIKIMVMSLSANIFFLFDSVLLALIIY
jgi:hypothetical protein